MLKIIAVAGWVLLALLLLVLWVLAVPRGIFVEYTEASGIVVKVRIFLFKIKVFSTNTSSEKKKNKPKKEKQQNKKTDTAAQAEKKKPDFAQKLPKGMELVKTVLSAVKGAGRILLRGIAIKDVSFTVPVSGGDAHAVQKNYAKITTAFYTFSIFLQKYVRLQIKNPVFIADFAQLYSGSTYFYCKIQASPGIILPAGWQLFKIYRNLDKQNTTPLKEK